MIKINVAEIRKRLTGTKLLHFEAEPAELDITEAELPVTGKVRIDGDITNVGDVLLLKALVSARVNRLCSRCLKEFSADSVAEVLEKYYPSGSPGVETDAYVYESDVVDITEPLREGLGPNWSERNKEEEEQKPTQALPKGGMFDYQFFVNSRHVISERS